MLARRKAIGAVATFPRLAAQSSRVPIWAEDGHRGAVSAFPRFVSRIGLPRSRSNRSAIISASVMRQHSILWP
jgi:hypothetical protein